MAGPLPGNEVDLAPADELVGAEYDRDFYSWSLQQARLVREGRWDAVDRDNVAEEIESLARAQFDKLVCALRALLRHILIWDREAQRRNRTLVLSVEERRIELQHVLEDNPGLKDRLDDARARAYRRARLNAAAEVDRDEEEFPETCPYSWDDIASRAFSL